MGTDRHITYKGKVIANCGRMIIDIPGKPIAKARPRFYRRGKFIGTYNSQQTEEGKFLLMCHDQITGPPIEGPVSMRIVFYIPRPKSHYGTGKNADKLKPGAPDWPARRPDIDNMEKFVADCLNGIAWKDDSQICISITSKMWDRGQGRTHITIEELT